MKKFDEKSDGEERKDDADDKEGGQKEERFRGMETEGALADGEDQRCWLAYFWLFLFFVRLKCFVLKPSVGLQPKQVVVCVTARVSPLIF